MIREHYQWTEKYRPHKIEDCILPPALKTDFQQFVDKKNIPTLLLVGTPGTGKTTVAKAMLEELDCDYYVINGSLKGNLDTLRNDIAGFASSVSFKKQRKYVILDEADYLGHLTQPALRNFMEEYSKNCGFILTANYRNKIIPALQSRCSVIEFNFTKEEASNLAIAFFGRTKGILDAEGIKYDKKVVATLISKHNPDWRRVLNELQRYSSNGSIDSGILTSSDASIENLIEFMKDKDFTKVRQWSSENSANVEDIFRKFYNDAKDYFAPVFIPELVLLIARYQFQQSFVADAEINLAAFLIEVMAEGIWK